MPAACTPECAGCLMKRIYTVPIEDTIAFVYRASIDDRSQDFARCASRCRRLPWRTSNMSRSSSSQVVACFVFGWHFYLKVPPSAQSLKLAGIRSQLKSGQETIPGRNSLPTTTVPVVFNPQTSLEILRPSSSRLAACLIFFW